MKRQKSDVHYNLNRIPSNIWNLTFLLQQELAYKSEIEEKKTLNILVVGFIRYDYYEREIRV
jgi:hypothetical protein